MKFYPSVILLLVFLCNSCKDSIELPCQELRVGLADSDKDVVAPILNNLLKDLPPVVTASDPQGHEENLDVFVERLNDDCDFEAVILCYTCVETFPPISEVTINFDSSGILVNRIIDIRTPGDDLMTVTNVHEF